MYDSWAPYNDRVVQVCSKSTRGPKINKLEKHWIQWDEKIGINDEVNKEMQNDKEEINLLKSHLYRTEKEQRLEGNTTLAFTKELLKRFHDEKEDDTLSLLIYIK